MSKDHRFIFGLFDLLSFGFGAGIGVVLGLIHTLIFPGAHGFWWVVVAWAVVYGLMCVFVLRFFRYAGD